MTICIPLGASEPHGVHLPVDVDSSLAVSLAEEAAAITNGQIWPVLGYGAYTNPRRLGVIKTDAPSIPVHIYSQLAEHLILEASKSGDVVVCHGSIVNAWIVESLLASMAHKINPGSRILSTAWWELVSEDRRDAIATQTGVDRTLDHHAAVTETSVYWHLHPGKVDHGQIDEAWTYPAKEANLTLAPHPTASPDTGVVWDARGASPSIGQIVWEEVRSKLRTILNDWHGSDEQDGPNS